MSASKPEKGPSAAGVFIAAAFVLFAGFLLGFVYMVSIPPQQYSSPYDYERALEGREEGYRPKPGDTYCYWAPAPYGIATWQGKRDKLLTGRNTSVTFSLSELNAWWASEFAGIRFEGEEEGAKLSILPGTPYFAVDEDLRLHVSAPLDVALFGKAYEIMLTVRGRFVNAGGDGPRFEVEETLLNSAPLPAASRFASKLFSRLGDEAFAAEEFDPYREALSRISTVEVGEASIRFMLQ